MMFKVFVTVLLVSFTAAVPTSPITIQVTPGTGIQVASGIGIDSAHVLRQLRTGYKKYKGESKSFTGLLKFFSKGYLNTANDYVEQMAFLETQGDLAEANRNDVLAHQYEKKGERLEFLVEGYSEANEMIHEAMKIINEHEKKLSEIFSEVLDIVKDAAKTEKQLQPRAPVHHQPIHPIQPVYRKRPSKPTYQKPKRPVKKQPKRPVNQRPKQPVIQQPKQPVNQQPKQPVNQQQSGSTTAAQGNQALFESLLASLNQAI